MKTYDDVKIGDTVYVWGYINPTVEETTVIEKYFDGNYWNLKFKNGCEGYCVKMILQLQWVCMRVLYSLIRRL